MYITTGKEELLEQLSRNQGLQSHTLNEIGARVDERLAKNRGGQREVERVDFLAIGGVRQGGRLWLVEQRL
jgi:hypothetical protein